ncbi:MAG: hypothetical protein ACYDAQ_02910 [Mycobacteriales bacterium]
MRRAPGRRLAADDAAPWQGSYRSYDIIKEATTGFVVMAVLTVVLAALFSSPDTPAVSLRQWARADPADFLATAASELAGTSLSARYGPPYNNGTGSVQRLGFSLQSAIGVRDPINPARAFVLDPLTNAAVLDPGLAAALREYRTVAPAVSQAWARAFARLVSSPGEAAAAVALDLGPRPARAYLPGYGPVPELLADELALARSGALDASLLTRSGFYGTNFTKPLLFLGDGTYFPSVAQREHMVGNQWGVMNETGSYPGQPWLWLYTMWYQLPVFAHSANVDLIAIYLTGVATLLLLAAPIIPGVRDLPRWIPLYRRIWREYYRSVEHPARE